MTEGDKVTTIKVATMEVTTREWDEPEYQLIYDDGLNNGYAFPVDAYGNCLSNNPAMLENLAYCKAHPEFFFRSGVIVERIRHHVERFGICPYCGAKVDLSFSFSSEHACDCGHWYNPDGQELLPPSLRENY